MEKNVTNKEKLSDLPLFAGSLISLLSSFLYLATLNKIFMLMATSIVLIILIVLVITFIIVSTRFGFNIEIEAVLHLPLISLLFGAILLSQIIMLGSIFLF